ncbi:hypothetical protein IQ219_11185 [Synechocystis sp. LEGE 06083]|uniref:hypothetical protein n=1 Tax=Synechocystis sp. LEGE 06083 TaxID=915336 RepID=UPI00187DDFA7|nr:hypothetical protein [Synechocystis sp. LEGE 06083]MBE9195854.1 hypothetical protein [Synechocystis sp. LEGE 06083]
MLATNSILKRLPSELDRKQLLFFDGMRHAVEIVSLAHSRLQATLTRIALSEEGAQLGHEFTLAFLDAWAIVDAIDRFRSLWKFAPGAVDDPSFEKITQPIRDLRNVSDHLAQRSEYVVARAGTALGILSWCTALREDGCEGYICTIVPGTQQSGRHQVMNPAGRPWKYPTSMIELAAGEYRACLCDMLPPIGVRVRQLEISIENALAQHGFVGRQGGTDLLIRMQIKANHTGNVQDDDEGKLSGGLA